MRELAVQRSGLEDDDENAKLERELLKHVASEARIGDWQGLRWYYVGKDKPRAIVIVTRGKKPRRIKTITANSDPDAWQSWQPVLANLFAMRKTANKQRVSHDGLQTGKI